MGKFDGKEKASDWPKILLIDNHLCAAAHY